MKTILACLFLLCCSLPGFSGQLLTPIQYLDTSGAYELTPFTINDETYIAVAQAAQDIDRSPAQLSGGNSDVDVIIYKNRNEQFFAYQRIPGHGNEGATFFTIGTNAYLVIASNKSGPHAPFNYQTYSMLYRWDGQYFYPVQQFFTQGARQWHYFNLGDRHFLALAQGMGKAQNQDNNSMIYEWNGERFMPFQPIPSLLGSSFKSFMIGKDVYLAFADQLNHSTIYRWDGKKFTTHQQIGGDGGRAFDFFSMGGKYYLAYANSKTDSVVYQWDGKQFILKHRLPGVGTRDFSHFVLDEKHYLVQINHSSGDALNPVTAQHSPLYEWNEDGFVVVQNLKTFGAVSARVFRMQGVLYLTVANSLNANLRYQVKSVVYQIGHGYSVEFG